MLVNLNVDSTLYVVRHQDLLVERHGWDVQSLDAELFWLPVVGPTSYLLFRRFDCVVRGAERLGAEGTEVRVVDLASSLGVKPETLVHNVGRLARFGLIVPFDDAPAGVGIGAYAKFPPLPLRHKRHLSTDLADLLELVCPSGDRRQPLTVVR